MNLADSNGFFDLFSVYLNTIDHSNLKMWIFMGILQVLRYDFQKFRILEILNFHPRFNIDYFCSDSGDLYTFGESDGGKLGLGDDPDDTDMPQKVLLPEKVKSVACGGTHTVALTGNYT